MKANDQVVVGSIVQLTTGEQGVLKRALLRSVKIVPDPRYERVRAALAELVRLKGLKDSIDAVEESEEGISGLSDTEQQQLAEWIADYDSNKPRAWAVAREALTL